MDKVRDIKKKKLTKIKLTDNLLKFLRGRQRGAKMGQSFHVALMLHVQQPEEFS